MKMKMKSKMFKTSMMMKILFERVYEKASLVYDIHIKKISLYNNNKYK